MIRLKIKGLDEAIKALENKKKQLQNVKGFYNEIGNGVLKEIDKSFNKSQSPYGGRWAPLKKPRPDGTTKPLVTRRGTLKSSFKIIKLTNKTMIIGSDVSYGRYHQFGTNTIPIRAFLPLDANEDFKPNPTLTKIIHKAMDKWFGKFDRKEKIE